MQGLQTFQNNLKFQKKKVYKFIQKSKYLKHKVENSNFFRLYMKFSSLGFTRKKFTN